MERVLRVNRVYNSFRSMYNDGEGELTFNEALVLEVLLKKESIMAEIQDILMKDRGYICRIIKKLTDAGYAAKDGRTYTLTDKGRREALINRGMFQEIMKDLDKDKYYQVSS